VEFQHLHNAFKFHRASLRLRGDLLSFVFQKRFVDLRNNRKKLIAFKVSTSNTFFKATNWAEMNWTGKSGNVLCPEKGENERINWSPFASSPRKRSLFKKEVSFVYVLRFVYVVYVLFTFFVCLLFCLRFALLGAWFYSGHISALMFCAFLLRNSQ